MEVGLTCRSEVLIILRQVGQYGESVGDGVLCHVLGVKEGRDAQEGLGGAEGQLVVVINILFL